jgi:uncharacterized protein with PIN domain
MSYWDTSTLVKLFAPEPDSVLFENHALAASGPIVTARIGLYEARATFRRKEADGTLQPGAAEVLFTKLTQDVAAGLVRIVELDAAVEREYGHVLDTCYAHTPAIPVRTLDALHLASVRVAGETDLVATDTHMRDAASALKLTLFPA